MQVVIDSVAYGVPYGVAAEIDHLRAEVSRLQAEVGRLQVEVGRLRKAAGEVVICIDRVLGTIGEVKYGESSGRP